MSVQDEAVRLARSIFELRKRRARHLPDSVLSEAAWNILLALFVAAAERRQIAGDEAIAFAEIAPGVGQRWIRVLLDEGLATGGDGSRLAAVIALTPAGIAAVEACMIDAQQYLMTVS